MIQWHLADAPTANLLLAHGAGAGMDSEFMQTMANNLAQLNINVGLFNFEYMQLIAETGKRRPPERVNKLLAYFEKVVVAVSATEFAELPLFIGGKSMGGRMASLLVSDTAYFEQPHINDIKGVIALGYPFHPPGKPDKLRTDHFPDLNCPLNIIQGQRDTFGNQQHVAAMALTDTVKLNWINDGDHSLVPRKKSGFTQSENWLQAAQLVKHFIQEQIS